MSENTNPTCLKLDLFSRDPKLEKLFIQSRRIAFMLMSLENDDLPNSLIDKITEEHRDLHCEIAIRISRILYDKPLRKY